MVAQPVQVQSDSRTVAISAVWNIIGRLAPVVVAMICTPILIEQLGPLRWGLYVLALSLTGVFSIFDFGLSRALTRSVAEALADGRNGDLGPIVGSGVLVVTLLGLAGSLVMATAAVLWAQDLFHTPPDLQREVLLSLLVLSASAPIVMLSTALWGVLAAFQKFKVVNLVNIPITCMYYIGPAVVLHVYDSLVSVMLALVMCRTVQILCYWRILNRCMPHADRLRWEWSRLGPILQIGGWMAVSNILWPFLTYLDRFIISSAMSVVAAGYYATCVDLIMRLSIVNVSIMSTAFPAITASHARKPTATAALFRRCSLSIAAILFLPCYVLITAAHPFLALWISEDFAAHAASILAVLAIGGFIVAQDAVAAGLLDGVGRPDINAKLSVAELIAYPPVLIVSLHMFGLEGAAVCWTLRCLADYCIRLTLASVVYPAVRLTMPRVLGSLAAGCLFLLSGLYLSDLPAKAAVALIESAALTGLIWRFALGKAERSWLLRRAV